MDVNGLVAARAKVDDVGAVYTPPQYAQLRDLARRTRC